MIKDIIRNGGRERYSDKGYERFNPSYECLNPNI